MGDKEKGFKLAKMAKLVSELNENYKELLREHIVLGEKLAEQQKGIAKLSNQIGDELNGG